jgi:hypothetical protein
VQVAEHGGFGAGQREWRIKFAATLDMVSVAAVAELRNVMVLRRLCVGGRCCNDDVEQAGRSHLASSMLVDASGGKGLALILQILV